MDFKGIKNPNGRYDYVACWNRADGGIAVRTKEGDTSKSSRAVIEPTRARAIAAELIRLADEIEGGLS